MYLQTLSTLILSETHLSVKVSMNLRRRTCLFSLKELPLKLISARFTWAERSICVAAVVSEQRLVDVKRANLKKQRPSSGLLQHGRRLPPGAPSYLLTVAPRPLISLISSERTRRYFLWTLQSERTTRQVISANSRWHREHERVLADTVFVSHSKYAVAYSNPVIFHIFQSGRCEFGSTMLFSRWESSPKKIKNKKWTASLKASEVQMGLRPIYWAIILSMMKQPRHLSVHIPLSALLDV